MTTHTQFFLAALVSVLATAPLVVWAWRSRLRCRALIVGFYVGGYALVGATLLVDSFVNPPLFFHGFTPGIGIGLMVCGLGQSLSDIRAQRLVNTARRGTSTT